MSRNTQNRTLIKMTSSTDAGFVYMFAKNRHGSFHVKSIKKSTNPFWFRSNLAYTLPLASKPHTPAFSPLWPLRSEIGVMLGHSIWLNIYLQMTIAPVLTMIEGCGFRQKQGNQFLYHNQTIFVHDLYQTIFFVSQSNHFCSWLLNDLWPFKVKYQKIRFPHFCLQLENCTW